MAKSARNTWDELRRAGRGDGMLEVPSRSTNVETGFGPARLGIGPKGEPRLLVPCSRSKSGDQFQSSSKLQVGIVDYQVDGHRVPFIDLMCRDVNLVPVFSELVEEVLERLKIGNTPIEAAKGTIRDFRELLLDAHNEEILTSKITGLIGELYMLHQLLLISPNITRSWVGSFNLRHDFRFNLRAMEIKTSTRSDTQKATIHGIEQLLEPAGGTLCLVHIRIERDDRGELTVQNLVKNIFETGADKVYVNEGLLKLGCSDPTDQKWNRIAFSLQGIAAYRVEDTFSRIVPTCFPKQSLPLGVSNISYDIDLQLNDTQLMSAEELDKWMRLFCQ